MIWMLYCTPTAAVWIPTQYYVTVECMVVSVQSPTTGLVHLLVSQFRLLLPGEKGSDKTPMCGLCRAPPEDM